MPYPTPDDLEALRRHSEQSERKWEAQQQRAHEREMMRRQEVIRWREAHPPTPVEAQPIEAEQDPVPGTAMLGIGDLAKHFGLDDHQRAALDQRLRRWRPKHLNGEWMEEHNPVQRSPRYLYKLDAVRTIADEV